jgi:hypothetical protein
MRKLLIGAATLPAIALLCVVTAPQAIAKAHKASAGVHVRHHTANADPVIYDSIIDPNPGNVPSVSFEATGTQELGNQVALSGSARVLDAVTVQMSSWACQSGGWNGTPSACSTTPGATFAVPITFNIYGVGPASAHGPSTAGSLLATDTQTFTIPYRPSADPTDCPSTPTEWYDAGLAKCFNGYFTDIRFDFGHVTLPDNVIYGITYNTNTSGFQPIGTSGPYDSLNVALSQEPSSPSAGTDTYQGTVYTAIHDGGYQTNYCDAGAAGISVFRIDEPANYPTGNGTTSGCWSVSGNTAPWYIPAVQFSALNSPSPTITSLDHASVVAGQPFSFTITTTGVPAPTIKKVAGRLPKGLVLNKGTGTATITGTASTRDRNGTYRIVVQAINAKRSRAQQRLMLTLSGGR